MTKVNLPKHIAIIMDGNGRWAKKRNLPRTGGHLEGVKRVEEIIAAAHEKGIQVLTLYAFSTENWRRPQEEVSMLMRTLIAALNRKIEKLNKSNIRLQFIGKKEGIPRIVLEAIEAAAKKTKNNTSMTVNVAFNYGGRQEIIEAIKEIAQKAKEEKIAVDDINEDVFSEALYTRGLPDPDLLIRTSGEQRISNFLLWQLSYAEFYFTPKMWPEFNKKEFEKAIADFQSRERRYGDIASTT